MRGDSVRIFDANRMMLLQYTLDGRSIHDTRALMFDIPIAWVGDSVDHWLPPGFTRTERSVIRRTLVGDTTGREVIAEHDAGFQSVLASTPGGKPLMRIACAGGSDRTYIADA